MCLLESVEAFVIAALEDVLEHILNCAVVSGRYTLTAYLIECLVLIIDESINAGIALFAEISTYFDGIRDAEVIRQIQSVFFVVCLWSHIPAELTDDFQHRALAGSDIAVEPKPFVGVVLAICHDAPVEDVVDYFLLVVSYLPLRTNLPGTLDECVLEFNNRRRVR